MVGIWIKSNSEFGTYVEWRLGMNYERNGASNTSDVRLPDLIIGLDSTLVSGDQNLAWHKFGFQTCKKVEW